MPVYISDSKQFFMLEQYFSKKKDVELVLSNLLVTFSCGEEDRGKYARCVFFLRCVCFNCEIVDTFSHDSYDNHCLLSSGCHMNRGHLTLGQFPFSGPRLKGKLR